MCNSLLSNNVRKEKLSNHFSYFYLPVWRNYSLLHLSTEYIILIQHTSAPAGPGEQDTHKQKPNQGFFDLIRQAMLQRHLQFLSVFLWGGRCFLSLRSPNIWRGHDFVLCFSFAAVHFCIVALAGFLPEMLRSLTAITQASYRWLRQPPLASHLQIPDLATCAEVDPTSLLLDDRPSCMHQKWCGAIRSWDWSSCPMSPLASPHQHTRSWEGEEHPRMEQCCC